ncbi:hypothetical protein [Kribbella sp. NPDC051718]|uniref:hypothetical protein n=1 Tax=Kribbella sp. NPDC051718 TaxID=3155168 RepID=UPI003421C048
MSVAVQGVQLVDPQEPRSYSPGIFGHVIPEGDMMDEVVAVDGVKLSDLVKASQDNDAILKNAVKRLEEEELGEAPDFFKHGQFGSHNS